MSGEEVIDAIRTGSDREWYNLAEHVEQLTRDLATSRAATESVQEQWRQNRAALTAQAREQADLILQLSEKHATQQNAARRSAAGLVLALKALQALRDLVMEGKVSNDSSEWPGEVFRAVQDAEEVIRAYGIPF